MTPKATAARRKWIVLVAAAVVLITAWRVLPLAAWIGRFQSWVTGLGPWGAVLYGVVYIVAVLLFVPGIVMTLGAGYIFGFLWGTLIVSVSSTVAAALAFAIARYLARARVEQFARRNRRFQAVVRAIEKNGWKVVALLRLSPLIPFSVSNYLYGLTSVRFAPFVVASWIAMLPATFLYVYLGAAGKRIGQGGSRSPAEWAFLGVGLAATIAVTVFLTRMAKKELRKVRIEEDTR